MTKDFTEKSESGIYLTFSVRQSFHGHRNNAVPHDSVNDRLTVLRVRVRVRGLTVRVIESRVDHMTFASSQLLTCEHI